MSKTDATRTITYNPQNAVPADPQARVAWLARHGVLPSSATLTVTLPLIDWVRLGHLITPTGQALAPNYLYDQPDTEGALVAAALRLVAESGQVVESLPAPILRAEVEALATAWAAFTADREAQARAKAEEAQARREAEAEAEAKRQAQAQARAEAEAKAKAEAERTEMEWLARYGTGNQRARHAEGLLPDEELLALVRGVVFGGLDYLADGTQRRRYQRLHVADHAHHEECSDSDRVTFNVEEAQSLTAEQYDALCEVRALVASAPIPLVVEAREHVASCGGCPGTDDVRIRYSLHVSGTWAGRMISREYAL